MAHMLVVEDDDVVGSVVGEYLHHAGHEVTRVADGRGALCALETDPADLVVLDLMLPGLSGLEVCRRLRRRTPDLPIVMLTALGEAEDRIAGLEVGADDYVCKPFSARELVLRVESVLRRSRRGAARTPGVVPAAAPSAPPLVGGDLVLDLAGRRATRRGRPLDLTSREFDLLAHLLARPGIVFTRDELMRDVWGWSFGDRSTVTVHVRRLREKVEDDPTHPRLLATVWGVGYRLDLPDTTAAVGAAGAAGPAGERDAVTP